MPRPSLPSVGGNLNTWGTVNNAVLDDLQTAADRVDPGSAPADNDRLTWHDGVPTLLRMREIDLLLPKYELNLDGTTNDSPALQAALDDLPTAGGAVTMPEGPILIGTNVVSQARNILLEGVGAPGQSSGLSNGGTRLLVASGRIGLTFGTAGATRFDGPTFRNFHIQAQSGAIGGLRLLRANNFRVEHVIASGFSGGSSYGMLIDGTGNVSQYGTFIECGANNCKIGLDLVYCNGMELFGGYFDGNDNSGSVPGIGSIGIRQGIGDTMRAFGTRVSFYDTGFHLADGSLHELWGVRAESNTTNIKIGGDLCRVMGGSVNNNLLGGTGVGIEVEATANRTRIDVSEIQAVATKLIDNGTDTLYRTEVGEYLAASSAIWWGGDTYIERSAAQTLHVNAHFLADWQVRATAGIGVGNSAAATTLGTVTRKMEVFDASGASLGFVAVYNAIT